MSFPKEVIETIALLEETRDDRLPTLYTLTEPREISEASDPDGDFLDEQNYFDMWATLSKHEQRRDNTNENNTWVLSFLDDVIACQKLPEYFYMKNPRRLKLITKINELTNELSEKLNKNLYVLSLIAALFLPLGFITGLLGINVGGMPGVDDDMAFWIVCAISAAVLGAEYYLFRILRWL